MEIKNRVYLSGPITGISTYKDDFDHVEAELEKIGCTNVINPAWLDLVIRNGDYEEYMSTCMHLLDMCDTVIMLPGWETSAGANREMGYALALGKHVFEWDKRGDEWRA